MEDETLVIVGAENHCHPLAWKAPKGGFRYQRFMIDCGSRAR
jgi:hypothetical protein